MHESQPLIRPGALEIGSVKVDPPLILAPMAGITDDIYRTLAALCGAGMVTTEMISAEGLRRSQSATLRLCRQNTPLHVPLAVQLFGSDPQAMAQAAGRVASDGAQIIDINAGCPVKKVVRQKAGAFLMKEPDRLMEIVEQIRKTVDIPLTVKLRLGWSQLSINIVAMAQRLESAGVDAVTIHARTAAQLYSGSADWQWIGKSRAAVRIPVIGNGDVRCASSAARMMRETGCNAIMIGRASLGNPWIFSRIAHDWGYQVPSAVPGDWREYYDTVRAHFDNYVLEKRKPAGHCRQILLWYSKGLPESARLRSELYALDKVEQMLPHFHTWIEGLDARGYRFDRLRELPSVTR